MTYEINGETLIFRNLLQANFVPWSIVKRVQKTTRALLIETVVGGFYYIPLRAIDRADQDRLGTKPSFAPGTRERGLEICEWSVSDRGPSLS